MNEGHIPSLYPDDGTNYHPEQLQKQREITITPETQYGPFRAAGISDQGEHRSEKNQDAFAIQRIRDKTVVIVADGISSSVDGKKAAEYACERIPQLFLEQPDQQLEQLILQANQELKNQNGDQHSGAALVVAEIADDGTYTLYHAGDVKAIHSTSKQTTILTKSHTLGQELYEAGQLPVAKIDDFPALSRYFGGKDENSPEINNLEITEGKLQKGETLLFASDGGLKGMTPKKIQTIVQNKQTPYSIVKQMIAQSFQTYRFDNATVVALQFGEDPDSEFQPFTDELPQEAWTIQTEQSITYNGTSWVVKDIDKEAGSLYITYGDKGMWIDITDLK